MSNFISHITDNIQEIADNQIQKYPDNLEEALSVSMSQINTFMQQMGLNENIIDDLTGKLNQIFNDLIEEGLSPEKAFSEAFQSVDEILNQSMSSASVKRDIDNENSYNLDFANSSQSENSMLIDQAMAKGMTVQEAIKYVNDQVNSNGKGEYGPPSFADINKIEKESLSVVKSDDENNLDKMKVDMDDQASKSLIENISEDKSHYKDSTSELSNDRSDEDLS